MHYRTTKNENVLFMCVEHNRIKALIYLLQSRHNYNINEKNINGETILHYACSKGHTQLISYLLTVGADMEILNDNSETPLLVATRESKK